MEDFVDNIVRCASIEEVDKVPVGQEHEIVVEKVIDHVWWKRSVGRLVHGSAVSVDGSYCHDSEGGLTATKLARCWISTRKMER